MKKEDINNRWEKLIGEDLPKIKTSSSEVTWVFRLLGWEGNARKLH